MDIDEEWQEKVCVTCLQQATRPFPLREGDQFWKLSPTEWVNPAQIRSVLDMGHCVYLWFDTNTERSFTGEARLILLRYLAQAQNPQLEE